MIVLIEPAAELFRPQVINDECLLQVEQQQIRKIAKTMGEFYGQIAALQVKNMKCFVIEQPPQSSLFELQSWPKAIQTNLTSVLIENNLLSHDNLVSCIVLHTNVSLVLQPLIEYQNKCRHRSRRSSSSSSKSSFVNYAELLIEGIKLIYGTNGVPGGQNVCKSASFAAEADDRPPLDFSLFPLSTLSGNTGNVF